MTINTNETANTSSLNNQDDNIGVLASEKTVSILSTTNKEGVSQKPKLKNNENSNHTIDDLTLKVHELTTIPVTPIPKLPDIYADSSTASNNNPLRNNKRVKGDESPNSDGSHPSSQHGQYVTVSNKKAEKRRKKEAEFPTMSTPEKDINFSTSRQVQYDAKLQQLQNRVFDISRHDHLPQYSALSPPDEKLSTHLIRSKHVILSGFHGAHAYNDNILGDIIREEVDAALKLIGYHDAIALWRHISTELPPTSDSYQSGVKVNWNAGIRIIPQLSTFSVLLELQQPIWAHNHGITDIDILPLTGILYSQSNITKTKFPDNRRGQYQQKPSIRQYRFQFLSDTISHIYVLTKRRQYVHSGRCVKNRLRKYLILFSP